VTDRRWSNEEVEEILRRALARQNASDDRRDQTTHEDLVAAAREVGIDTAAVEAAAAEIEREKVAPPTAIVPRAPWPRFLRSLATYAIVNSFLFAIDLMTGPGFWVQWVLIGWGIGLAFRAAKLFFPTEEDLEKEKERAAKRAERKERRLRRKVTRAERREREREFEEAVEAGVHALLGAAAKRIKVELERPKVRVEVREPEEAVVEAEREERKRRA
jgi:hypothetical protein